MNTDLISVIIPSYKPDNYIYKCLESVARQDISKQRFEVIIVLNGCNEPYHTDIKLFLQQKFQGIKTFLLQTDVAGVSNARNIGLDNARGEYIAFIDDDDIVSENYLSELYQTSYNHPLQIVACNVTSEECIYYRRIRQNSSSHTAMNWMKRVHIAGSLLKRYVRLLSTGKYNLCFIVTRMLGTVREYIFYC